jgi:fructose-1,6-bisphosphatase/inositol monophosphatase family enzyme
MASLTTHARVDMDAVAAILRDVAATEILPRFRNLQSSDIREKHPGDLVTVADEASERVLTARLRNLLPSSIVVGEEACAADPALVQRLASAEEPAWIIDPVDGTHNFAHGKPIFGLLLALSQGGRATAGWIYDPLGERMAMVEAGEGAWMAGQRLTAKPAAPIPQMQGSLSTKFFSSEERQRLDKLRPHFADTYRLFCAAHDYLNLLTGVGQFAMYNRIMPWDHAAGTLAYAEAGGHVAKFDGTPYRAADVEGGLLMAPDPATWADLRNFIFPAA